MKLTHSLVALLALVFVLGELNAKTVMVSHKGAWSDHLYPQNSLPALKRAIDLGFKGIEFDVLLTKDHQLVLAHENKIKRISNCEGKISQLTLKKLESCHVNRNATLPLSQIIVKKVKRAAPFVSLKKIFKEILEKNELELVWIDLKSDKEVALEALSSIIYQNLHLTNRIKIVLNSTSASLLMKAKELIPGIYTSLEGKWGSEPLRDYVTYLDRLGVSHDMISLNVGLYLGHESFNPFFRRSRFWKKYEAFISETKERQATVIGWTVNKKKKIKRLIESGIPYLLTDNLQVNY